MERRKRQAGVLTYDDLLIRLRQALEDPVHSPRVRARLQGRYQVVLVDEFQDTDPVQWDILRLGFGGSGATLVLIGDPKQAIYAFRGADVYAYLEAAREAGTRATLAVNWRSDQGLINAYDALFRGARLGHEGIAYRAVRAAETNQEPRLAGAPVGAPPPAPAPARARGAAPTASRGWGGPGGAAAGERAGEDVHARLHRWAGILRRRGVASLLETVTLTEGLPRRVLGRADGERRLTDLRHIGQLLHAAATAAQLGPSALTTWLRQRIAEAAEDTDNE